VQFVIHKNKLGIGGVRFVRLEIHFDLSFHGFFGGKTLRVKDNETIQKDETKMRWFMETPGGRGGVQKNG